MKRLPVLVLCALVSGSAIADSPPPARVLRDGRWGLVASDGSVLVQPSYDLIYPYRNGYTVAVQDGKRAYLDAAGRLLTPFAFDTAYHFFNELAPVEIAGKYGLLNKEGKLAVEATLGYPDDYGHFYVAHSESEAQKLVYNDEGRLIARVDADYWPSDFGATDQLVVRQGGRMGVLDRGGSLVVPATYAGLSRLDNGLYAATDDRGLTRILDHAGATLYQTSGRITDCYAGYLVTYDQAKRAYAL